jgi:hypothetical protein
VNLQSENPTEELNTTVSQDSVGEVSTPVVEDAGLEEAEIEIEPLVEDDSVA